MTEVWDEVFDERTEEPLGLEPEQVSEEFLTLLNGQRLYHEENFFGQRVRLRTLTAGEELECGLLVSKYNGTPEEGRAYIVALVGAAIDSVDGRPIVESLNPIDNEERVKRQFDYVRKTWYWTQIQYIYERGYLPLLDKLNKSLEELRSK